MQVSAIQSYNTTKPLNNKTSFKSRVSPHSTSGMDMFTIKALTNKKVKNAYERFAKFYSERHQSDIPKAFSTCINADGTLSKYALYTFNSLYNGQFTDLWTNIKQIFSEEKLRGFTPGDKQYGNVMTRLAGIIGACKDKNNNQNKENLKFAQELFLRTEIETKELPMIINALKNEDGVCSKENIAFFNILKQSYYASNLPRLFESMLNKDNVLTESAKNFVLKLNGGDLYNFAQKEYIFNVLNHTKNAKNRDEILDFVSVSDYLKSHTPSIAYYRDKDGNVDLNYLKKYLEINKDGDDKKGLYVPAYIYQSKDETITNENIEQLLRLTKSLFNSSKIESFAESEFFKKGEAIDKDFVDFILDRVDYMFKNPDSYAAYRYLDTSVNCAIEKDGSINWDMAEMLQNFAYKFGRNKSDIGKNIINKMIRQVSELCKDENGNFSKEKSTNITKDLKYLENNFMKAETIYDAEDYLLEKYLTHIIGDKNLYNPEEMLEILNSVELDYKILHAKIPEYESLLFAISEIPTDKNPQIYSKILQKIDGVRGMFFDVKDSHGISFLEKILNSENKQLLKLITHPSKQKLVYNSELDYAYNSIQDKGFKRLVNSELKLSFPLLEEAVKLHSTKAWDKVKSQLNSPLCHRKEVLNRLWILAIKTKDREFCANFAKHYINELPEDAIIELNRMKN